MMDTIEEPARVKMLATVLGFAAIFVFGFVYFWTHVGGGPQVFGSGDYTVSFRTTEVKNLQEQADVTIAGIKVGYVESEKLADGHTVVKLKLDKDFAPLHEGATVRVGVKSVIGASYVDVIDGGGAVLGSGSVLPDKSVIAPIDVDEVIRTFDPATRKSLSSALQALGVATDGTSDEVAALMDGLSQLGDGGYNALAAISAQSEDLKALTRETGTLLEALDTGRGQIAQVVRDAQTLTAATSGQKEALAATVRALPGTLDSARTATADLTEFGHSLAPVASSLRKAAPDLNQSLIQLPSVTHGLRSIVPSLDSTLKTAPATLERVPTFGTDVQRILPDASLLLEDVNPMLAYLRPYGRDIGSMFANFGASMDLRAENGVRPVRLAAIFNTASVRGFPLPLTFDPTHWNNPYPAPGQVGNPKPFKGTYPRVERDKQ